MKLTVNGNISSYYVQTLCLLFFPGEHFPTEGESEEMSCTVSTQMRDGGAFAEAQMSDGERTEYASHTETVREDYPVSEDRLIKLAVGHAVVDCAGKFTKTLSPWGMLTGVRPAKLATEILQRGFDKDSAEKLLMSLYGVLPEKSALCTNVALAEKRLIPPPEISKKSCSLYVSIPFCPTRCAYCSFVSFTSKSLLSLIPQYLSVLCEDIRFKAAQAKLMGFRIASVYVGGGTPTTLSEGQLEILLSEIAEAVSGEKIEEFTVEAGRPDTITKGKFAVMKKYGVTRVSVNTQTLNDEILSAIGRNHTSEDFLRAFHIARESGIGDINVDLIAGLPGESTESSIESAERVCELLPENITVHSFSVKKSAELRRHNTYDSEGEIAKASVSGMHSVLSENGYLPYYMYRQKNTVGNLENVGFSKLGHECMYNIYMMEEVHSIFSAGASAVTKFVKYSGEGALSDIKRIFEPKYPYEYLREHSPERLSVHREEFISDQEKFFKE